MPDFLDTASAWLDTVHREQVSQTVTIKSGAASTDDVPATIGSSEFQEANDDGIITSFQSRDYLIAVTDYQLAGNAVTPEAGHLIIEGTREYEVTSPGNEPCVRFSDASQRVWRIHTKLVSQ
jgi:hypothetical protein